MGLARPAELNFTRIFTWPQYFIGHLMPGHVLPCPSVARRRPPMNQSAAFKDFFLIARIRNPPYLAWNILRAILRLFLSFPPILSFFSSLLHPLPHLVPAFQRRGWSVCCWQRAERGSGSVSSTKERKEAT